jgi:hypothetical protein
MQHRAGQRQALLPAAGQLACQKLFLALEGGHAERPGLALGQRRAAQAVDATEEAQVLAHAEVVVQAEALAHVADPALHGLGVARDVDAQDVGAAARRRQQTAQHPDRRRLARAVGPEEAEDLAFFDRERNPVHGGKRAEALAQVPELDGDRHG